MTRWKLLLPPPLLELPLLLHITLLVLHDGDTAQLFLPPTA